MKHSGAPKKINDEGRAKANKQTESTPLQGNAEWEEKNIRFHNVCMQSSFQTKDSCGFDLDILWSYNIPTDMLARCDLQKRSPTKQATTLTKKTTSAIGLQEKIKS